MTLKFFFKALVFILISSLGLLVYMLFSVNPQNATGWQFFSFFILLFLVSFSFFTLFGYIIRAWISKNNPLKFFAKVSARQGALLASLVVVLMYLQSLRSLSVMGIALLITSLVLLELAFLTK